MAPLPLHPKYHGYLIQFMSFSHERVYKKRNTTFEPDILGQDSPFSTSHMLDASPSLQMNHHNRVSQQKETSHQANYTFQKNELHIILILL